MGKKDETVETKQTTQPWQEALPQLKDILGRSQGLFNSSNTMLEGRNVGESYDMGMGALGNMFRGTGPLSALSDTASGNYLDVTNSPQWGSMIGGIQDAVNSQFSMAGRTGSPAHAGVMTQELGNLAGRLYDSERQRQLGAAGQLGQFQMGGLQALPGMYDFGNADIDNLWKNLARYSAIGTQIGGMGGTQTGEQPDNSSSDWQQGIGAALSLASLFAGSDRNSKIDIEQADDAAFLEAIKAIPAYTYRYKIGAGDDGAQPRVGPMAQDWAAQFGGDGKVIPMPQMLGAMFAAIKAIATRLDKLEAAHVAR